MIRIHLKNVSDWYPEDEMIVTDFPYTIGRHPECGAQMLHPLISRQHCRFYVEDGEVWVKDLESLNGTTWNGKPLREPVKVQEGDELGLPCHHYRVSFAEVPAETY